MKRIVSIAASLLLLFNGTGALYGGWLLIADPSGARLKMSSSILAHTPFPDFLLPGVVLFVINGISSLVAITAMLTQIRQTPVLVALQGCLLSGWIVIQYCWTQVYHPLQVVMGSVGLLLIVCSVILFRIQKKEFRLLEKNLQQQRFLFN